jgi:hypothetical protein
VLLLSVDVRLVLMGFRNNAAGRNQITQIGKRGWSDVTCDSAAAAPGR